MKCIDCQNKKRCEDCGKEISPSNGASHVVFPENTRLGNSGGTGILEGAPGGEGVWKPSNGGCGS